LRVISAWNDRRSAPRLFDAASFRSAVWDTLNDELSAGERVVFISARFLMRRVSILP
jgi:hypothetical protein